jgi:hypothetical protein
MNMNINLNERDASTVVNGLRIAAERYDEDAALFRKQPGEGLHRLAEHFDGQAADARRIADAVEAQS